MTVSLSGNEVARQITDKFPEAVCEVSSEAVLVKSESIFNVIEYLKSNPEFDFDYLNYITAVDYLDCFEMVYQLTSRKHNHSLVVKTRCYDRNNPIVPSIVKLWRG
ncbi:NADH-quinone oxidoreductase subunit C, partial [Chloroflexota bacterium]